jgi:hypothetical protein
MAWENPTCTIENHPDFNEPSEIRFTSVEQIIPTLRVTWTQGLYRRRRDLEQELASIRFQHITERGVAENGVYHDVNSWLRGIAIQAEICWLNTQINQLEKNTEWLLVQWKELARKNEWEFGLYRDYVLSIIDGEWGMIDLRIILLWQEKLPEDSSYVDAILEPNIKYFDIFWITEADLRWYIANPTWLDDLYTRIQTFQFSDL